MFACFVGYGYVLLKSDNFKKLIGFIVRTLGSQSNNETLVKVTISLIN